MSKKKLIVAHSCLKQLKRVNNKLIVAKRAGRPVPFTNRFHS
jgi:hypothetical protein